MKKFVVVAGLMVAATSLAGCRKAQELTAEQVAEALANQAISTYNTAALDLTINGKTFSVGCESGGEITWEEFQSDDQKFCYKTDSKSCVMSGSYGSITLEGPYEVCGFPKSVSADNNEGAIELEGQELTIVGSVTASAKDYTSRACEYDLKLSGVTVVASGNNLTFSSDMSGTACGDKGFDVSTSFTVEGNIEPTEESE